MLDGLPLMALVSAFLALAFGGVLKGATGAGAPIVAVPVIALYFDVQTAIVTLILPNVLTNVLQGWRYRAHLKDRSFAITFAAAGVAGAALGTVLLANAPSRILLLMVSIVVLVYVAFRLMRPNWRLPMQTAQRVVLPIGTIAGLLQGATGVSAPVSITFLNALGQPREWFIATISLFFVTMSGAQVAFLSGYGILSPGGLVASAGAFAVILAFMPVGEALARRISPVTFNRLMLVMLTLVALRILLVAVSGG